MGQAGKGVQNIIFACFLRSKISFLVWRKVDWPYLSMGSGRNSWEEGRPGTGRGAVEEASYSCSDGMLDQHGIAGPPRTPNRVSPASQPSTCHRPSVSDGASARGIYIRPS